MVVIFIQRYIKTVSKNIKRDNKMKHILVFNTDDEFQREELAQAMASRDMAITLFDIRQELFRPARKHGFNDAYLNEINKKHPELFETLEKMFNDICERNDTIKFT